MTRLCCIRKWKKNICKATAVIISAAVITGCGSKEVIPQLLEPAEVSMAGRTVKRGDICNMAAYMGSIKSYSDSYAFSDSCSVKEIDVHIGEYVEAGQRLAVMDCLEYEQEKEQLESDIHWLEQSDDYQSKMDNADIEIEQMQLNMMVLSSKDTAEERKSIEDGKKALEAQKEQADYESGLRKIKVEEKRKQLKEYEEKIAGKELVAQKSGYVTYVKEFAADNPQRMVDAEDIIIMLSDKQEAYVAAGIVDAEVRKATEVYVEVGDRKIPLTYVPYSDQERRLAINEGIALEARFVSEDRKALAQLVGENATVYLISNRGKEVLSVAPDSLFFENGEYFVYLIADGRRIKQPVTPGLYTENAIEITEGLKEGDLVYYPVSNMPGNSHTTIKLEAEHFQQVKKYDQVNVKRPSAAHVLVEPENAVLEEILVGVGDKVNKGDVLAVLSVDEGASSQTAYSYQLEELKRSYEYERTQDSREADKRKRQIEAMDQNKTQNTFAYKKTVQELSKLDNKMVWEDAKYQYETQTIERKMEKEKNLVGRIEVKAQVEGIVTEITQAVPGYSISKNTLLCKIADSSFRCIMVYAEGEILPTDSEVSVDVYQSENRRKGRVICSYQDAVRSVYNGKRILKESIPQMVNVSYVALENEEDYEQLNSFGISVVEWSVENAILIPAKALYNEEKRRYVWLMEDGQMEKRYVTPGYNNGKEIWILQGVTSGDELIVEG